MHLVLAEEPENKDGLRLVPVDDAPKQPSGLHLVPVDDAPEQKGGLHLVPVDDPAPARPPSLREVKREQPGGMRLVPADEPPKEPSTPDGLNRAIDALWKPVPAGTDLSDPRNWPAPPITSIDVRDHHPAPEPKPEPKLPPGVYEENGVFMRERPGKRPVPVGEKALEQPMYDPGFDLAFDLASGGLFSLMRAPLKAGGKDLLKAILKGGASDAAWGGLAGWTMEAVNQATDNEIGATMAGLASPLAARLALTGGRKALAKGFEKAADRAVKKSWGLTDRIPKMEGTELAGHLQSTFGTRAEAIGPDVQGMLLSNEAKTANELKRIAAEMGRHTLNTRLQKALTGKVSGFFMHPDDALILGQRARDFAARVSPKLAARMGLTPDELRLGSKLVEAMPAPDVNGVLRFGVKVKGKDGAMGWAHDLDPVAAQKAFMEQRPQLQKLVLAYIAPKGGWRNAPRLADVDYDAGFTAFGDISRQFNLDKAYLENEFKSQGKDKWIGALEAGGGNREQLELATDYMKRKAAGLVKEGNPGTYTNRHLAQGGPRRHPGPYMPAKDGSFDWGYIPEDLPGWEHGPIRLHRTYAYKPDFKHSEGIKRAGYQNAMDAYQDVLANYTHIWQGDNGSLILGKKNGKQLFSAVRIVPAEEGRYYTAKTILHGREDFTKNKELLWAGAQSPHGSKATPSAISGRSSSINNIATSNGRDNLKERLKGRAVKGAGNGLLDTDLDAPEPSRAVDLAALGRDELHGQLVKAGILEPGQYAEGYLARFGDSSGGPPSVAVDAPDLRLGKVYEPMAQRRGAWFNSDRRLDDTINLQRQVAQESVRHRQLLRKLAPVILEEVPQDAKLGADDMMRTREVYDPAAGRKVWRNEALTEVYVPPDEAEALGVKEGRYLIPKALNEHFSVLMGREKSGQYHSALQKMNDAVKSLATYWTLNVLSAPGTIATNAIGGAAQYSSKWFEDLMRGDLRKLKNTTMAPFMALSPKYRQAIPKEAFGEGANLWRGMDEGGGLLMKDTRRRMQEGEKVSMVGKALAGGDAALHGALKAHLAPFSGVDDYWKRSTYLAEARTRAENWVDAQIKAGKADPAQRGQLVYDRLASTLSERPEEFADIMLGDVDRFAYLYQNTPAWMQKARRNPYFRLFGMPFVVYPYKYSRMVGSQLNAFNPLSKMPMKERVARAGGLIGSAGAPAAATYAYLKGTGQESQVEKQRERFKEEHPGKQWPGTRLGGRGYVGTTPEGKERYFRWVKYGPWGLPAMAKGVKDMVTNHSSEELTTFFDDFKSRGPGLDLLASYFEMNPRYGPSDIPSQAAEFGKGFIPFHRWQRLPGQGSGQGRPGPQHDKAPAQRPHGAIHGSDTRPAQQAAPASGQGNGRTGHPGYQSGTPEVPNRAQLPGRGSRQGGSGPGRF